MSNAKVRARRRRRGNRAWTAAMTPIAIDPQVLDRILKNWGESTPGAAEYRAFLRAQEPVDFAARSGWSRTVETRMTCSQPNVQNLKPRRAEV